ncbi:hypothetical protein AQI84_33340 [Streptomyces griseorubiginosus]|nr:hypothetical protein AQI84_33340 [Streptomyces griseorubiginosus]
MSGMVEAVMPRQVRTAQLLLLVMAFAGMIVILVLKESLTSYGLGHLMAPWLLVWVCALLALTYTERARGGTRVATIVVMVFVLVSSFNQAFDAAAPSEFVDAALRILFGVPVVVLLFLPEARAWFDRAK